MKLLDFKKPKLFLGKKYLDWAEKLPKFQGGIIRSLQVRREYQRKCSERCYVSSRAPEGTDIKYKELVLIDTFELEDVVHLIAGLKKLFPNIKNVKESIEHIEKRSGSLWSSGTYRIGTVTKSRPYLSMGDNTVDPALPSYVDCVSIWGYGVTPSVTAIAFTFSMTNENTAELDKRYNHYYLPDIEFNKIIPWGIVGGGYRENSVESVMQRNILNYTINIRDECERWVSKYFKPNVLGKKNIRTSSLSPIEIFEITGVPKDEKIKEWNDKARGWGRVLGISLDGNANFTREQYTFCWPSTGYEQQSIPVKILVSNEYEYHNLEYVISSLIAPIALKNYLNDLTKVVERMRVDVYRVTKTFSKKLTKRNVINSLVLKRKIMILKRMRVELNHNKSWIFHLMESVDNFKSDKTYYGDKTLDKVLYEHILNEIDRIEEHGQIAENNITDYVNSQNILAMFTLQNRMLSLTIVITFITLISVLINYDKFIYLWNIFQS